MSAPANAGPSVIWVNGAFGVGKTEVVAKLHARISSSLVYDPEPIGSLLRTVIPGGHHVPDFQDLPTWRDLTRDAVLSLATRTGSCVLVPMTVTDRAYFEETVGAIGRQLSVAHVTLVAPSETIASRLARRPGDNAWALGRVDQCVERLASPVFALHVDTDGRLTDNIAAEVLELAGLLP
jgi:AAA domain